MCPFHVHRTWPLERIIIDRLIPVVVRAVHVDRRRCKRESSRVCVGVFTIVSCIYVTRLAAACEHVTVFRNHATDTSPHLVLRAAQTRWCSTASSSRRRAVPSRPPAPTTSRRRWRGCVELCSNMSIVLQLYCHFVIHGVSHSQCCHRENPDKVREPVDPLAKCTFT